MSDLNTGKTENKKRKRGEGQVTESTPQVSISLQISQLEDQILESRKNYNNITKLLQYVQIQNETRGDDIFAALSLCRVFHRLMISGNMSKSHETSKRDAIVIQWLLERYSEYKAKLLAFFHPERAGRSSIALQLFMQLIKSEALQLRSSDHTVWRDGIFPNLLRALIENPTARTARNEFIEKYLKQYDDVRYYTYGRLT